jgi:chromosome segregation ATPase
MVAQHENLSSNDNLVKYINPFDDNAIAATSQGKQSLCLESKDSPTEVNEYADDGDIELPYVDTAQLEVDVDHVLEARTDSEARIILRGMVLDLLTEVENLRIDLYKKGKRVTQLKQERKQYEEVTRGRIEMLYTAVCGSRRNDSDISNVVVSVADDSAGSLANIKAKIASGQKITLDETTAMVVEGLTRNIEKLSIDNHNLLDQLRKLRERYEDMSSSYAASTFKVEALETQFKFINKTRQKVVSKLVDRSTAVLPPSSSVAH